jgi:peptidoglycan/xylan/chitin deacetylase (PgdA/CDA1 family)
MFNDSVIESIRQAKSPLDLEDLGLGLVPLATSDERRAAIDRLLSHVKYLAPQERERLVAQIAERAHAHLPTDLMMTSAKVHALHRAGMEIGAHTLSHPILARIGVDEARREIDTGRRRIQEIVASPIRLFAYPNGKPGTDYRREHVALVRELGFDAAVSTAWGTAGSGADLFQIPRFTPWDRGPLRFGMRLARNLLEGEYARA